MANFKDLVDAVHDIKKTHILDGTTFIAENETVRINLRQWNEILEDPYLHTLPVHEIVGLTQDRKVLGVNIVVE